MSGERDLVRDSESALRADELRRKKLAGEVFKDALAELEVLIETPGALRREAPVDQDSEEGYAQKLAGKLKSDWLRHAGSK